ncbi:hypothetical protein [Endozoicomonas arenosclerae]|uniref:hypothetical protein n=1 Tax=Endozoicomonas arenosclerae TaxID=1633495 RepID=UPI0007852147|nr:hypothetical protein [Endozoicomonas arenosclerae]
MTLRTLLFSLFLVGFTYGAKAADPSVEELILSGWKWVDEKHPITSNVYPLNQNQSLCLHRDDASGQPYPGVIEFQGTPYRSLSACHYSDGRKSYSTHRFWALRGDYHYYLLPSGQYTGLIHSQLGISDQMRNICMVEDQASKSLLVGFKPDNTFGCSIEGDLYPNYLHFHHQGYSLLNQVLNLSVWTAVTITSAIVFAVSAVIMVCIVPDELWGRGAILRAEEATTL